MELEKINSPIKNSAAQETVGAINNNTATTIRVSEKATRLRKEPVKDSTSARVARFAAGSIFGVVFLVICFVMLTTALKGPDTVTMNGVTAPAGLYPPDAKPTGKRLVEGMTAPDFVLNQLDNSPVQLSKLRGKTVLINFWASWCQPCIDEMPDLQKFYQAHRNDNIQILAVNYREDASAAKGFFKDHNLTMPMLLDKTGIVAGGYDVPQFPESYFVDKNGIIQAYSYGPMVFSNMETKLNQVWQVSGK